MLRSPQLPEYVLPAYYLFLLSTYYSSKTYIAFALVLVSVMLLVYCGKSERACGSSRDALRLASYV